MAEQLNFSDVGYSGGNRPRQVAACRPKCTVSRQTAHLAALMLRPTVNRWGMLWCILSFTRRPNSVIQTRPKNSARNDSYLHEENVKQKHSLIGFVISETSFLRFCFSRVMEQFNGWMKYFNCRNINKRKWLIRTQSCIAWATWKKVLGETKPYAIQSMTPGKWQKKQEQFGLFWFEQKKYD